MITHPVSYSRVPGDGNNWPENEMSYFTTWATYLPAKTDSGGNRFVCFSCHDPHGTSSKAMIRGGGRTKICGKCHSGSGGCFCHGKVLVDPDEFDTGALVQDDNTLLLLHLDGDYEGTSKEQPTETTGLSYTEGKYGSGVSFDGVTSKLVYPLWTNKLTGAPGQHGVQHDSAKDLTIRFDTGWFGEDGDAPVTAAGVTYEEGYIDKAMYLGVGNTLTYDSSNINISNGSFEAWIKVGSSGTGIRDITENRYIFLHATGVAITGGEIYKDAIFMRHSCSNMWEIGVSDETGFQCSVVSVRDGLTSGWHHIAGAWSKPAKQLKIYIDGALAASERAQFFPTAINSTFRIGSSGAAGGSINTSIDEVQISNYTKPDAEILEDYNCQNEMNFDPRRGTLAFWVKPYWDGNDGAGHYFFENYYDKNNYFRLWKTNTNLLEFAVGNSVISCSVDSDGLSKDEWLHIAASWEDFGPSRSKMKLYLGGKEVGSSDTATMLGHTDTAIYFGPKLEAIMDEIWITNVAQESSVIENIDSGYVNTNPSSPSLTPIPTKSYLPNPGSLGLLLHYDTTFNGADGEIGLYQSVFLVGAKFDSGVLIAENGYLSYFSGDGYHELSSDAGMIVKHFNNNLGCGVLSSKSVTFDTGFLGGANGAVLVDGKDVLSFISSGEISSLEPGLVGLWHMNETSGATVSDSSGYDNHGTTMMDMSIVDGKIGNTRYFDGTDSCYVEVIDSPTLSITGDMTILAWVNVTNFLTWRQIVSKQKFGTYSVAAPYAFYLNTEQGYNKGGVPILRRGNGVKSGYTAGIIVPATGVWQHIAVTMSGTLVVHYLNGKVNGSSAIYLPVTIADCDTNLRIGGGGANEGMLGYIDEVAIFNRALDSSEINNHFVSGDSVSKTAGTIHAWVNVNSGIKDSGVNRYIFRTTTDTTTNANQIALYRDTTDNWIFHTSDSTGTNYTKAMIPDNLPYGWHNFAGTWNSDSINLYVDGELKANTHGPKLPDAVAGKYYLGSGGTGGQINTSLDEFLLDPTAKTADRILANMRPANYNYNAFSGTIEMWMKPVGWDSTETAKRHYFFDARPYPGSDTSRISLYYDTTKEIKFDVYSSAGVLGGAGYGVEEILNFDSLTFHHYAGTWGKNGVNLYVDGSLVCNTTLVVIPDKRAHQLFIGSDANMANDASSVIDEVRIFDTVRNAKQIFEDAGGLNDYRGYYVDVFNPYEGGSCHPINPDKAECLKCHLQSDSVHGSGVVEFVNVDVWDERVKGYNNSTKSGVTLFCLSCHMNPKADPFDTENYFGTTDSPYRFTGSGLVHGGDPVQLRPLTAEGTPTPKPEGGYYYPIDTASAHFDSSFGPSAVGGLSCTDCHDPHGSINKSLLQDFEEKKDDRDYNRDGVKREVNHSDLENVKLSQLNEEKFCYFCHNGKFNTTGVNPPGSEPGDEKYSEMKDIEGKFAHSGAHHMVDDKEQADKDARIECTNCHNPHIAKRDEVVLNQQTGKRAYVTTVAQMNSFCVSCHGDSAISPAILTAWSDGVQFPGALVNKPDPEWSGNLWNEFNKQPMTSGNKHYDTLACTACHDSHGSSNYRGLIESTDVYGLKLMTRPKPDGRTRYELYSTVTGTGYGLNKFCFGCHKDSSGVYPGEIAYILWDFGIVDSSAQYNNLTKYDSISWAGYSFMAPDIYGKDKDCDYCHNPHGPDSIRAHMVRDNVPQDLDRNSLNYGNRIDEEDWFQGFPAAGVDFCLSRGCHVTNRFAKLGPRDIYYQPGGNTSWAYKPYDQFNLLDYGSPGALEFSGIRPESFITVGVEYTTARASKHPIVSSNEFRSYENTLTCSSCHMPHGSPGNTELAKSYGGESYETAYPATFPQDNAALRRAYYRRIYWWPVTFWKRGYPFDIARASKPIGYHGDPFGEGQWLNCRDDVAGNWQKNAYFSPFSQLHRPPGSLIVNSLGGNPLLYNEKTMDSTIPSAGNDLCFMSKCHEKDDIIGTSGSGIDINATRFIGHEAVIGGAQIGKTEFDTIAGWRGLNKRYWDVPNDFHNFTCSMCHGPHAATNEKLITNKCFAYNKEKPPQVFFARVKHSGRPSVYCHPYDNNSSPNWNVNHNAADAVWACSTFYGWRNLIGNDSTAPMFDTAWWEKDSDWADAIDPNPADNHPEHNLDGIRTGTSESIKFVTGVDPRYEPLNLHNNDNIFRLGDRLTFYFRVVRDSTFAKPENNLLLNRNGIYGDFSSVDAYPNTNQSFGGYKFYGNGLYGFHYTITDTAILSEKGISPIPSTIYESTSSTYINLPRVKIKIIDKSGNASPFDTTYRCILDNDLMGYPEE
ncbi:MAG: LamG-like jellyroll fold domain-containing protein [bacterium]